HQRWIQASGDPHRADATGHSAGGDGHAQRQRLQHGDNNSQRDDAHLRGPLTGIQHEQARRRDSTHKGAQPQPERPAPRRFHHVHDNGALLVQEGFQGALHLAHHRRWHHNRGHRCKGTRILCQLQGRRYSVCCGHSRHTSPAVARRMSQDKHPSPDL
ncbi:hypothetical protein GGI11_008896, partial [Coemansia sp. RSA 2049]